MYKSIIVDDEKNIRERLSQFFPWGDYNYQVVGTAKDGRSAISLVEEHSPHLIFTDIKMPKMDGLQLIENLSLYFPEVEVVILSAYDDFELAQKAIGFNVQGYLLKPIMKNDFKEIMDKITKDDKSKLNRINEQRDVNFFKKDVKSDNNIFSEENEYIIYAKKYINEHYKEQISIKNIADKLFIHEAYFSKLFNEQVGEGVSSYLNGVRIEKAKNLLRYSDDQLKHVSSKVGFSTQSYFNKVFKQLVGVSPLVFRKKNRS